MQSFYDYKRYLVLYVDDEEMSLKYFKDFYGDRFRILTATNAADGFQLLEKHKDEIGILMSDQRMAGEKGVQLLERSRSLRPRIIRILVTAFADPEVVIEAVNSGAIYKYINKPWNQQELEYALKRGMEFFIVQNERDELLREKIAVLHKMVITDRIISLGVLAAGLGHHIRNALVAVRTFLELTPEMLNRENLDLESLRYPNYWNDFYEKVQANVRLILDLLDFLGEASEKGAPNFESEVRLDEVFRDVADKMGGALRAKQIELIDELSTDLPALKVDYPKFRRLFELLLRDEIINLPRGSRITVRAHAHSDGLKAPDEIQIEFLDNGPGLPEDALRAVFDPFYVRNDNPMEFGLNLMACYFIVYHHGGRIEVNSESGKGLSFLVTLPTRPKILSTEEEAQHFLSKAMMNEKLWENLLAKP